MQLHHSPTDILGTVVLSVVACLLSTVMQVQGAQLDEDFLLLMAARNAAKAERYEVAAQRYRKLLQRTPAHPDARTELGWVLVNSGNFDEGQKEFAKVLQKNPGNIPALRGRFEGLKKSGKKAEALTLLEQLVQLFQQYEEAEAHFSMLLQE